MKRLSTYFKLSMIALTVTFAFTACEDEPEAPKAPLAFFTSEADADNSQLINFTNETEAGDTYVWDFGDGSATSTETSPSYEYAEGGAFTVKLTATNAGGDNTYSEEITVVAAAAENLVVNGSFDDDSAWTFISLYKSDNTFGDLGIGDGTLNWTENDAEAWKHLAAYQEISLEAGTYSIDMMTDYAEISEIWGEVFVGTTVPTAGTADADSDYSDNLVLNMLNGWDCSTTYTGSAVELNCKPPESGTNGVFTLDAAGTYYLVIKSGGKTYGTTGIKIDDVEIFKQ